MFIPTGTSSLILNSGQIHRHLWSHRLPGLRMWLGLRLYTIVLLSSCLSIFSCIVPLGSGPFLSGYNTARTSVEPLIFFFFFWSKPWWRSHPTAIEGLNSRVPISTMEQSYSASCWVSVNPGLPKGNPGIIWNYQISSISPVQWMTAQDGEKDTDGSAGHRNSAWDATTVWPQSAVHSLDLGSCHRCS